MDVARVRFWSALVALGFGWMLVAGLEQWFARLVCLVVVVVAVALWALTFSEDPEVIEAEIVPDHVDTDL